MHDFDDMFGDRGITWLVSEWRFDSSGDCSVNRFGSDVAGLTEMGRGLNVLERGADGNFYVYLAVEHILVLYL